MVFGPFHDCAFCETCCAGRAGNQRRSEALHRMSLSDNLRRLARERIPTAPAHLLVPTQNNLRRCKSRFTHPKLRIYQYSANSTFATPADALEKRARSDLALSVNGLADSSQSRVEVPAQFDAVEADH